MQRRSALLAVSVFSGLLALSGFLAINRAVSLNDGAAEPTYGDNFDNAEAAFGPEAPPLSDYVAQQIARQGGASLPVLVPFAFTADEATARAHGFRLKLSGDGYTAVMHAGSINGGMDIVITGAGGPAGEISEDGLDYIAEYEDFSEEEGGSISFGFASCDYQVEFYCPPDAEATEGEEIAPPACIGSDEAEAFALELVSG